jgi:hypothetical protein
VRRYLVAGDVSIYMLSFSELHNNIWSSFEIMGRMFRLHDCIRKIKHLQTEYKMKDERQHLSPGVYNVIDRVSPRS